MPSGFFGDFLERSLVVFSTFIFPMLCSREGSVDFYVRIAAPIPLFPPFYAFISNPLTPLTLQFPLGS